MARGSSSRSFFIYSVSGRTLCHARTPFFAHFSQSWHLFNSQRMEWILIIQTPTDLLLLIMDLEKIDRYFLDGQMGKKYFKTFNDITFHLWVHCPPSIFQNHITFRKIILTTTLFLNSCKSFLRSCLKSKVAQRPRFWMTR